jgi:hypothetical protein
MLLFCIALSYEVRICDDSAPLLFTFTADVTIEPMSVLDEKHDELEHYEFRMGVARGRLAVALDSLTDALTMVGQHGVYCQSARQPGKPAMDIQIVMKGITDAKELITSVMEEIRKQQVEKDSPRRH